MEQWQTARDNKKEFPPDQQAELDNLVEAELIAATARTTALVVDTATHEYDGC